MIELSAPEYITKASITLSGSKSISNRLLILDQVLNLNLSFKNLSESEDTQLLQKALEQLKNKKQETINVHHAGTDMRFLAAYLSITKGEWTLTGSERMKQRPIGELVGALNKLGADITFLEKENFPPLLIKGKKFQGGTIEIDSSVSSQFISAMLLISPYFEKGIQLKLTGQTVSLPYIKMTIELLRQFKVNVSFKDNIITVVPSIFNSLPDNKREIISIESDWSSASYWYSICALSLNGEIELRFLNQKSWQADSVLPDLYKNLGVKTTFKENSLVLTSTKVVVSEFHYDFTDCPDIAQTLAVSCFGLGLEARLTGLSTLKVKESDRIVALKTELDKFGAEVEITTDSLSLKARRREHENSGQIKVQTYNDHRIAMSFAPLAIKYKNLKIEDPSVVAKSYPAFWEDLKSVGFNVNLHP